MAEKGIRVEGLRDVVRSLEKFGIEVSDLKAAFKRLGSIVSNDAKSNVNSRTGALANSIKPSNTKNKSIVRAGSARVPYAGVIHYGGYNNITANPYLTTALDRNQGRVQQELSEEIGRLIQKLDLK